MYSLLHLSCSSKAVTRLDYQILLKLFTLNLLAGSNPAVVKLAGIFTKRIWQPYMG